MMDRNSRRPTVIKGFLIRAKSTRDTIAMYLNTRTWLIAMNGATIIRVYQQIPNIVQAFDGFNGGCRPKLTR